MIKQLDIMDLFNVTIFGDDVANNKPGPECYITAAKLLGTKPEECLIFEDSEASIAAA